MGTWGLGVDPGPTYISNSRTELQVTKLVSFIQVVMDTLSWSDNWLFVKECWTSCSRGLGRERLGMLWNVWTGETVNIDVVKQETRDDDFVDSTVEVETTRLTYRA